ncbi:unnamed protein product [Vitrella brassicaformis CCMP3155]|uniref:ubiquitinyl hydrolase 1 n=3 Tax=Vitrella brassicaformis TaxID=1169539 RepID=A0A0G4EA55_VITBC|nr:unnamed protein product [Vitrella brassicaformis CCMP3155]|eukprot:CEL92121.1 unnamed protein product [Vitrella brassicaformis CCMP3155]
MMGSTAFRGGQGNFFQPPSPLPGPHGQFVPSPPIHDASRHNKSAMMGARGSNAQLYQQPMASPPPPPPPPPQPADPYAMQMGMLQNPSMVQKGGFSGMNGYQGNMGAPHHSQHGLRNDALVPPACPPPFGPQVLNGAAANNQANKHSPQPHLPANNIYGAPSPAHQQLQPHPHQRHQHQHQQQQQHQQHYTSYTATSQHQLLPQPQYPGYGGYQNVSAYRPAYPIPGEGDAPVAAGMNRELELGPAQFRPVREPERGPVFRRGGAGGGGMGRQHQWHEGGGHGNRRDGQHQREGDAPPYRGRQSPENFNYFNRQYQYNHYHHQQQQGAFNDRHGGYGDYRGFHGGGRGGHWNPYRGSRGGRDNNYFHPTHSRGGQHHQPPHNGHGGESPLRWKKKDKDPKPTKQPQQTPTPPSQSQSAESEAQPAAAAAAASAAPAAAAPGYEPSPGPISVRDTTTATGRPAGRVEEGGLTTTPPEVRVPPARSPEPSPAASSETMSQGSSMHLLQKGSGDSANGASASNAPTPPVGVKATVDRTGQFDEIDALGNVCSTRARVAVSAGTSSTGPGGGRGRRRNRGRGRGVADGGDGVAEAALARECARSEGGMRSVPPQQRASASTQGRSVGSSVPPANSHTNNNSQRPSSWMLPPADDGATNPPAASPPAAPPAAPSQDNTDTEAAPIEAADTQPPPVPEAVDATAAESCAPGEEAAADEGPIEEVVVSASPGSNEVAGGQGEARDGADGEQAAEEVGEGVEERQVGVEEPQDQTEGGLEEDSGHGHVDEEQAEEAEQEEEQVESPPTSTQLQLPARATQRERATNADGWVDVSSLRRKARCQSPPVRFTSSASPTKGAKKKLADNPFSGFIDSDKSDSESEASSGGAGDVANDKSRGDRTPEARQEVLRRVDERKGAHLEKPPSSPQPESQPPSPSPSPSPPSQQPSIEPPVTPPADPQPPSAANQDPKSSAATAGEPGWTEAGGKKKNKKKSKKGKGDKTSTQDTAPPAADADPSPAAAAAAAAQPSTVQSSPSMPVSSTRAATHEIVQDAAAPSQPTVEEQEANKGEGEGGGEGEGEAGMGEVGESPAAPAAAAAAASTPSKSARRRAKKKARKEAEAAAGQQETPATGDADDAPAPAAASAAPAPAEVTTADQAREPAAASPEGEAEAAPEPVVEKEEASPRVEETNEAEGDDDAAAAVREEVVTEGSKEDGPGGEGKSAEGDGAAAIDGTKEEGEEAVTEEKAEEDSKDNQQEGCGGKKKKRKNKKKKTNASTESPTHDGASPTPAPAQDDTSPAPPPALAHEADAEPSADETKPPVDVPTPNTAAAAAEDAAPAEVTPAAVVAEGKEKEEEVKADEKPTPFDDGWVEVTHGKKGKKGKKAASTHDKPPSHEDESAPSESSPKPPSAAPPPSAPSVSSAPASEASPKASSARQPQTTDDGKEAEGEGEETTEVVNEARGADAAGGGSGGQQASLLADGKLVSIVDETLLLAFLAKLNIPPGAPQTLALAYVLTAEMEHCRERADKKIKEYVALWERHELMEAYPYLKDLRESGGAKITDHVFVFTYVPTEWVRRGLVNNANLCYSNSVVQNICPLSLFVEFLKQCDVAEERRGGRTFHRAIRALCENFFQDWKKPKPIDTSKAAWGGAGVTTTRKANSNPFDTKDVAGVVLDKWLKFITEPKHGRQQDAAEFFLFILEHLHEECKFMQRAKNVKGADEDGWCHTDRRGRKKDIRLGVDNYDSPVRRMFGGTYQRDSYMLKGQHRESAVIEHFNILDVPVDGYDTLVKALDAWCSFEECIDEDDSGHRQKTAETQCLFDQLRPILILHLKRYRFNKFTGASKKLEHMVAYPEKLVISKKWLTKSFLSKYEVPTYELVGLIAHDGQRVNSGHYRAMCRYGANNEWYQFNDTSVSPHPLRKDQYLGQRTAMMLYYVDTNATVDIRPHMAPRALLNEEPSASSSSSSP